MLLELKCNSALIPRRCFLEFCSRRMLRTHALTARLGVSRLAESHGRNWANPERRKWLKQQWEWGRRLHDLTPLTTETKHWFNEKNLPIQHSQEWVFYSSCVLISIHINLQPFCLMFVLSEGILNTVYVMMGGWSGWRRWVMIRTVLAVMQRDECLSQILHCYLHHQPLIIQLNPLYCTLSCVRAF